MGRKSLTDSELGQEQPLLPHVWSPYHTNFSDSQTMPGVQTGNLSAYFAGCHRSHSKGESILLVHARNFRGSYKGLVAGFLEPGETLEECVNREVMEETGLTIKNLKYFGSQPWPYPSGIMIGYTAEYESGTIKLQDEELSAGAFYTREHLPEIPKKLSIARKMIDAWLIHKL